MQEQRLAFENEYFELQKTHANELIEIQKNGMVSIGELTQKNAEIVTKASNETFKTLEKNLRSLNIRSLNKEIKDIEKLSR